MQFGYCVCSLTINRLSVSIYSSPELERPGPNGGLSVVCQLSGVSDILRGMAASFPSIHSFRVCCFMDIFLFVVLTLVATTGSSTKTHLHFRYSDRVNITNLIQQYALVCGLDFICDSSLTHFNFLANSTNHEATVCRACDCSDNCFKDNTCCPDKELVGPISTCLSANLVAKHRRIPDKCKTFVERPLRYRTIATCPLDDLNLQARCGSEEQSRRNVYNCQLLPLAESRIEIDSVPGVITRLLTPNGVYI
ncbi:hypothetical protein ScPMuIL_015718 [Solemya velum]